MSTLKPRIATALQFTDNNPVLRKNETGIELDTGLYKIGDGITEWNDLEYVDLYVLKNITSGVKRVWVYGTDGAGFLIPISELGSSIESITISNRWTLTNADVYYRSRGDFGGFNVDTLNVSTTNSTIIQIVASLSSSFYCTSKSKSLKKIYIDGSNITSTLTSFKLGVFAFQRAEVTNINFSAINLINLGEFNLSKTSGTGSHFWEVDPTNIEIPAGYLVSCVLMRTGGTGTEINCSMTFKFDDYVA